MTKFFQRVIRRMAVVAGCIWLSAVSGLANPPEGADAKIQQALKQMKSTDWGEVNAAEQILIKEGHQETIERLIAEFLAGDTGNSALESHWAMNAGTLPFLFPALKQASFDAPPVVSDVIHAPPAIRLAVVVTTTIRKEADFPAATKAWAAKIEAHITSAYGKTLKEDTAAQFSELEQWWAHNQVAVKDNRLQDATWLPNEDKPDANREERRSATTVAADGTLPENSGAQGPLAASEVKRAEGRRIPLWLWITISALLVSSLAVWRMKIQGRKGSR